MPIASELSINTSADAFTMADTMFGSGVTVVSATYSGDANASGTYTGGNATLGSLSPSDTGVILSTGQATDFTNSSGTADTNTAAGTSTDMTGGIDGDADLDAVSGQSTFDGAFLEAVFVPDGDTLTMQFVFSSEEYLEYVNGGVNDAVGIWVNGVYVPLDTGDGSTTAVSIDTVNNTSNENLYLDNPAASDPYNTEMDGATVVLSVTVPVNAGVQNDIRIGIADGGDAAYDSNLLIMGDSVQSQSIAVNDSLAQGPNTSQVHNILNNDTNDAGNAVSITHINNEAVVPGDTVTLNTGEQITLNPDGTITVLTDGDIGSNTFTYSTVDTDGTPATGFVNIETTATPPNFIVEGTAGADTIDASYTGDPEGDMIDNGDHSDASNNDSVVAGAGDDSVVAGDGDDTVFGEAGADTILGGDGNDSLDGDSGADSIDGGAGDDTLIGDEGVDTLLGGDGADEIYDGGTEGDSIDGGAGADSIFSGAGDDTITGGSGADSIVAGTGDDSITGDAGADTIEGGFGADTIDGGTGADSLTGGAEDDSVSGGDDNDWLTGGDGNDTVDGGAGADSVYGGEGDDSMLGGSGNDTMEGWLGNDTMLGEDGDDYIDGAEGADSLVGGTGDDTLLGGNDAGSDTLEGGAGSDSLSAGDGTDILAGGTDADSMFGGGGDDTFVMEDGFGNDTIDGWSTSEVDGDTLDLSGLTLDSTVDLTSADPEDGTVTAGGDTATFVEIENIVLGGGRDSIVLADGSGADIVSGFDMTDSGDGTTNDQLDVSGLTSDGGTTPVHAGDVTVGNDGSGNAVLSFPGGESITLVGVAPSEVDSVDELVSIGIPDARDEIVEGTGGDDTIDVGYTGDPEGDMVDAGDNSDGDDDDVIDAGAGNDSIVAGLGDDTVYADEGDDTVFGEDGNDSIFGFEGSDVVDGGAGDDFINTRTSPGTGAPDEGFTGTGTPPDYAADTNTSNDLDSVIGGTGNDTILTGDDNDTVFAGADDDSVDAGFDDDSVFGEAGDDTLEGGEGNDTILGGADNDLIYGELSPTNPDFAISDLYDLPNDGSDGAPTNNGDSLDGGDGNDTIFGQDDDDTIDGGAGADSLDGGTDNDSITGGSGADTILGGHGDDTILAGQDDDTVDGGIGNDSIFGNEGNDTLQGGDGSDTMDGGSDDDVMYGGDGADTVYGNAGNDTLFGGAGDDFVRGSFGEDELHGGEGDDSIWAGFGDDTIIIEDNFGNDSIDGDFDAETNGDTLDLSAVTTGLTVDMTNSNPETGTFSDGTHTANFSDIENIILGSGNDTITLADFSGDDTVYGFQSPTVNGDGSLTGNDMLDVSAVTSDFGTTPVNARDVVVTDDGAGNAVLNFPNGESLTLDGVDPVTAADHAYLVAIGIPSNEIVDGTAGDDAMGTTYVDSEGDQTDGTDGLDDTIYGYAGDDTIDGGLGDDTIDGGDDDDVIDGGAGADSILGGAGNDTITGGAEGDEIDGGAGDDSLSGGAGDDTIDGWIGDDTLVADGGDDSLTGFDGDDTFELTDDTGNTTVVGGEDVETAGDTLDLSGVTEDLTVDLTDFDWETGTVTDGTNTTNFSEIENIVLGGGTDTLVLADGSGSDTIEGFEAPTPNGDGTFSGEDQLDVTGLTSDGGTTPIHAGDVVVTDDGAGNAVLNFPGGETLTLIGIPVADASDPAYLVGIGIPSDGILTGTGGDDTIETGTWIDEDTDVVDGGDAIIAGHAPDDDSVVAGAGNDIVNAGAGDDTVDAGFDNDTVDGGAGDDSLIGGSGEDVLLGGADNDTLLGEDGNDTLDGGTGADSLSGGDSEDSLTGGDGDDTLEGGVGRDTLNGEGGDDSISGGDDQDTINLSGDEGDDTIDGGSGGVDDDTLVVTDNVGTDISFDGDESGTGTLGTGTIEFSEIENITTGSGADTIDASADSTGLGLDGGAGADSIVGGSGADSIFGGDDADTIEADRNDTVDGGSGGDDNDTLVITGPATITYDFPGAESGTVEWLDGQTMTFSEIENITYIPCFTPGTLIKTARGEVPVEQLRVGDRALTRDNGYQMIRWIGSRDLSQGMLAENTALRPIRISAGALGDGLPVRDMMVSPQHRMLVSGPACELWFGEQEVLVAAVHLTCLEGIDETDVDEITYLHILFDQHEVVMSDGTWSESFQPGDMTLGALDAAQRGELLTLFPELADAGHAHEVYPSARLTLKAHQARVLFG